MLSNPAVILAIVSCVFALVSLILNVTALAALMIHKQNPEDGPPVRSPAGVPHAPAAASPPAAATQAGEREP